jgi:glutathione S-transferase
MSFSMMAQCAGMAVTGSLLETKYAPNTAGPGGLSSYFALTPAVLMTTGLWIISYGMKVGQARKKAIDQAKKDGEENVIERYGLPNLYAQGTSKNAIQFNCVQRSHQQCFEHYTQAVVTGLMGAVSYPLLTAGSSLLYFVGRRAFSTGYATGDPKNRYGSALAKYMWYGLLMNHMLGMFSCANWVVGKKLL